MLANLANMDIILLHRSSVIIEKSEAQSTQVSGSRIDHYLLNSCPGAKRKQHNFMHILIIVQGEYGRRIAANIQQCGPAHWVTVIWQAPAVLPPVIDYPEEYLPKEMPAADLILSLGEHPGVVELLPDLAQLCGAQAVIAPIDNVAWLPPGLMRQVEGWLMDLGVDVVFPKPFCSLSETTYNLHRRQVVYQNPFIAEFARHFGQPTFQVTYDQGRAAIAAVHVVRDAACGCAHYVAEHLARDGVGISADEAEHAVGLLHHHYPCLASMGIDPDYNDTLMHVSGNLLKEAISAQMKPYKCSPIYLRPPGRSE
jgi:hypothetical protein